MYTGSDHLPTSSQSYGAHRGGPPPRNTRRVERHFGYASLNAQQAMGMHRHLQHSPPDLTTEQTRSFKMEQIRHMARQSRRQLEAHNAPPSQHFHPQRHTGAGNPSGGYVAEPMSPASCHPTRLNFRTLVNTGVQMVPGDLQLHFEYFGPVRTVVLNDQRDAGQVEFREAGTPAKALQRGVKHKVKGQYIIALFSFRGLLEMSSLGSMAPQNGLRPASSHGRMGNTPSTGYIPSSRSTDGNSPRLTDHGKRKEGPHLAVGSPSAQRPRRTSQESSQHASSYPQQSPYVRSHSGATGSPRDPRREVSPQSSDGGAHSHGIGLTTAHPTPSAMPSKKLESKQQSKQSSAQPAVSATASSLSPAAKHPPPAASVADGTKKAPMLRKHRGKNTLGGFHSDVVRRDALDLSMRYRELKSPEEFVELSCNYIYTSPPTRNRKEDVALASHIPLAVCEWLIPTEETKNISKRKKKKRVSSSKMAACDCDTSTVDSSTGKKVTFHAHVLLHTMDDEANAKGPSKVMHMYERLKIFTSKVQFEDGRMLPGGIWSRELDGGDPTIDERDLLETAIRCTKEFCGVDLSSCSRWVKLAQFVYDDFQEDSDEIRSVIFATSLPQAVPKSAQWENFKSDIVRLKCGERADRWKLTLGKDDINKMDGTQLRTELKKIGLPTVGANAELMLRLYRATKRTNLLKQELPSRPSLVIAQPIDGCAEKFGWHGHELLSLGSLLRMYKKLGGSETHPKYNSGGSSSSAGCQLYPADVKFDMDGEQKTFEAFFCMLLLNELLSRDYCHVLLGVLDCFHAQEGRVEVGDDAVLALKFFDHLSSGYLDYGVIENAIFSYAPETHPVRKMSRSALERYLCKCLEFDPKTGKAKYLDRVQQKKREGLGT